MCSSFNQDLQSKNRFGSVINAFESPRGKMLENRSLFDDSGCLVPWFHGTLSRDEATKAIKDWEASSIDGSRKTGVFLFRYSDRQVSAGIRAVVCAASAAAREELSVHVFLM